MRKLTKFVNFLITLKINKMPARSWGAFLPEELNITKSFVAFWPVIPCPTVHIWVEKSAAWQPPEGSWSSFKATSWRIVIVWHGQCFLGKNPTWKIFCIWPDSKLIHWRKKKFPWILLSWGCLSITITGNCLTLWLCEVMNSWGK